MSSVADASPSPPSQPLLEIDNVVARYGQIEALRGVSLRVEAGEAVAVLGANGAGKSTLMRCVMGLLACASGRIRVAGVDLARKRVSDRAALGIGYSPEGRRIFPGLTVHENLLVASRDDDDAPGRAEEIYAIFPALREKGRELGWSLSGGQQQMLSIGRALMARPRLLLLDEPSLGLSPKLTAEVLGRIQTITAAGTAVLLAEQNAYKALTVSHRAYVIQLGRVIKDSTSSQILSTQDLTAAFLGA